MPSSGYTQKDIEIAIQLTSSAATDAALPHLKGEYMLSEDGAGKRHVLANDCGVWHPAEDAIAGKLSVLEEQRALDLIDPELTNRTVKRLLDYIEKIGDPRHSDSMVRWIKRSPERGSDMPVKKEWQFNRATGYLPTASGVVDLNDGLLLDHETAGELHLTDHSAQSYNPELVENYFDQPNKWRPGVALVHELLDPLGDSGQLVMQAVGHALRGSPEKRIYYIRGERDGGKSTLCNVIAYALGPLAGKLQVQSLGSKSTGSGGLSPELLPLAESVAVFVDDVGRGAKINTGRLKDYSGGGTIMARGMYKGFQKVPLDIRATIFILGNPGDDPDFDLRDRAFTSRLHVIEMQQLDSQDVDKHMRKRVENSDEALDTILSLLVHACIELKGEPPEDDAFDKSLTELRKDKRDVLGRWLRANIVYNPGTVTFVSDIDAAVQASGLVGVTSTACSRKLRDMYREEIEDDHTIVHKDVWNPATGTTRKAFIGLKLREE